MIFTEDHGPAHVHVFGPDSVFVFLLQCPRGPVRLRERMRGSQREMNRIARVLNENLDILCTAWRNLHGE
ncbi:DUF4160 domain-containing protein [Terriglobus sp. ADX1]|uniref:DUF4160 domain-containing protein n=1 Tax=Terriglobus sp. ADX1 TaxID=2794063 RepID=UPI003FCC71BD